MTTEVLALPATYRFWPFRGGAVRDMGLNGQPQEMRLDPPAANEVVARVDAASICASDIKIIRMGAAHPLFESRDLDADPVVLGHEIAMTVVAVGERWRETYRPGDRLGLQPAITVGTKRMIVGVDLPGGMSEYIRLDERVLGTGAPDTCYVFPLPVGMGAAAAALLEPYSCVEAAHRQNCRTTLKPHGRMLIVGTPGSADYTLNSDITAAEIVVVDPAPALATWAEIHGERVVRHRRWTDVEGVFDDILLCADAFAAPLEALIPKLDRGGMMTLVGLGGDDPIAIDVARIHYQGLSFVGTRGPEIADAYRPERNRFGLRAGGTALIVGGGGPMGRIHVHLALQMRNGPALVIATELSGHRMDDLRRDFEPMAEKRGKKFLVVANDALDRVLADVASEGCDDVVVVAPDVTVVERVAGFMKPDGMLVVFAGMPYGQPCRLPIGRVASAGARFTGSTGSTIEDELSILSRVTSGELDIVGNLEAVAGFAVVPEAFAAVTEGRMSGKIVVYPGLPDLALTRTSELRRSQGGSAQWTYDDESRLRGGSERASPLRTGADKALK
ncbi:MAG: alcohol dehydrogenase catalytic domain-containing protein [Bradyrhizobium sp.]|nr:alcohol dehydrogenase catalytic domain-containing protein [Bradyrhizobium sp.]